MKYACTVCGSEALRRSLDLGRQPPSNRFLAPESADAEERHPLSLGDCADCGTVQLVDRMPIETIRPRFDWLANSEPEGHLDDLVDKLACLPGIHAGARFLGVSYKDRSTLERLAARGFAQVAVVAPDDLPIAARPFGLETIQRGLSDPATVDALRRRHGQADVLLVRHMVEHAESAARFLAVLRGLVSPGGYLVLEFPDNERILRGAGHAFVWEEHFSYFTADSFRALSQRAGAEIVRLERYPYLYEDALVAVLRFAPPTAGRSGPLALTTADDLRLFAARFPAERRRWQAELSRLAESGRKLAVFGAGHLAVKFINFMELAGWIDCVIDDHPAKAGLLMPGSRLPIVPSAELAARGIDTCVTTLSPESEIHVRQKLADYFQQGGCFIPAFRVA